MNIVRLFQLNHWYCYRLVGAGRFELPASWSRTKRATGLRYAPQFFNYRVIRLCKQGHGQTVVMLAVLM